MKLANVKLSDGSRKVACLQDDELRILDLTQVKEIHNLSSILHSPDPVGLTKFLIAPDTAPVDPESVRFLSPIDQQEIWAAGVTYKRSQVARMEESEAGASHYDLVYAADRPELFFKSTPEKVVAPEDPVRARKDSGWSVPEPEFTLLVTPEQKIAGYTIGNDMSARDIEGENPLYLPQAKTYRQSCAVGPVVLLASDDLNLRELGIRLLIKRNNSLVFTGETDLSEMARTPEELVSWLFRENDFPNGAALLTGTGIIPPDDFTLEQDDFIEIQIDGIGSLRNPVIKDN